MTAHAASDAGAHCPECGAPVAAGSTCHDNFHALLALEATVPGAQGGLPHFYAVASYGLQHPDSMGFLASTLSGLRDSVAAALAGEPVEGLRRRATDGAARLGRVTRREGEPAPRWDVERWPTTVADVLAAGADSYADSVEAWARSIVETTEGTVPLV